MNEIKFKSEKVRQRAFGGREAIMDVDGNVLYVSKVRGSFKEAFGDAVKAGISMKRADLSGKDISGLRLGRIDFSGANLSRADLSHSRFGAFTDFSEAILSDTDLTSAVLPQAVFHKATLDRAKLDKAHCAYGDFMHVRGKDISFVYTNLHNADFRYASFTSPDFRYASFNNGKSAALDMEQTPLADGNLDFDRTFGARIVGGIYDKTEGLEKVPKMVFDKRWGTIASSMIHATAVAGFAALGAYGADTFIDGHISKLFGGTAMAAVAIPVSAIFKSFVTEALQEKFENWGHKLRNNLIDGWTSLKHDFGEKLLNKANMVVTFVLGGDAKKQIERGLKTVGESPKAQGWFKGFYSTATMSGHMIICDGRALDAAIEQFAINAKKGRTGIEGDIIFVRTNEYMQPREDVPYALKLSSDGSMTAVWEGENAEFNRISYGPDGLPTELFVNGKKCDPRQENAALPRIPDYDDVVSGFGSYLGEMKKHRNKIDKILDNIGYNRLTHSAQFFPSGEIIVKDRRSKKIDNPHGPAIYNVLDGWERYFLDGSAVDPSQMNSLKEAVKSAEEAAKTFMSPDDDADIALRVC